MMNSRTRGILWTLTVCLGASSLASLLKILYGRHTNSLAFVADGIHSLFDSGATVAGMVSIYLSTKPPDEGHPYGHYKFETLSSLGLGLMLFLAAHEMGTLAYDRLMHAPVSPRFDMWGFVIIAVTMVINLGIAWFEGKQAKKLSSAFLEADSFHNQSDFLISIGVLASTVSAWMQFRYIDALVSILITLYLAYLAVRLILNNLQPLVDSSVLDPRRVEAVAGAVEGVIHCHHVRSRGEQGHYFLDLNLHLPGHFTLERAHDIAHEVEARLKREFPGLMDVIIHTEPHGHAPCAVPHATEP